MASQSARATAAELRILHAVGGVGTFAQDVGALMAAFSARVAFDLHGLCLENGEVEKDHRDGDQGGQDAPDDLYLLLVFFIEQHSRIIL
jgi:hypothetical protein